MFSAGIRSASIIASSPAAPPSAQASGARQAQAAAGSGVSAEGVIRILREEGGGGGEVSLEAFIRSMERCGGTPKFALNMFLRLQPKIQTSEVEASLEPLLSMLRQQGDP